MPIYTRTENRKPHTVVARIFHWFDSLPHFLLVFICSLGLSTLFVLGLTSIMTSRCDEPGCGFGSIFIGPIYFPPALVLSGILSHILLRNGGILRRLLLVIGVLFFLLFLSSGGMVVYFNIRELLFPPRSNIPGLPF